jgi:hypothetical protein
VVIFEKLCDDYGDETIDDRRGDMRLFLRRLGGCGRPRSSAPARRAETLLFRARRGVGAAGERDAAERYSEPSLFTVLERSR